MQAESYELQKAYYEEMVTRQPMWTLVDIYPDEGISGTSMRNRHHFLRMIEDCKAGKLTLIVTKSISRFARNVVDAISTVRMLRNLPTPVAVWFETEQINTMRPGADSMLSLLASFAESESLIKSTSIKWAIRNRFKHGLPRIVDTYGFNRDKTILTPSEEGEFNEAQVVREMYAQLLQGKIFQKSEDSFTIKNPITQRSGMVANLNHHIHSFKRKIRRRRFNAEDRMCRYVFSSVHKNKGHERQYRIQDYHTPIIPKDEWIRAQRLLNSTDLSLFMAGEPEFIGSGDDKASFSILVVNRETDTK